MRFLFVDRILELVEGKSIKGIKHITLDDAFLDNQHNKTPSLCPSLAGETLGQLAAWNIMQHNGFKLRPIAGIFDSIKFYRPAFINETLFLHAEIDSIQENVCHYHGSGYVNDKQILSINGAIAPMLPMETFIDTAQVKSQFEQIYRPGEFFYHNYETHDMQQLFINQGSFCFDRITSIELGQSITAEKRINFASPYFPDHFPKKPVLPLSVLIESAHNLAQHFLHKSGLNNYCLAEAAKIKIKDFIQPGDVISCQLRLKHTDKNIIKLLAVIFLEDRKIGLFNLVFTKEAQNA